MAKLGDDTIEAIREQRRKRVPVEDIARTFRISLSTVQDYTSDLPISKARRVSRPLRRWRVRQSARALVRENADMPLAEVAARCKVGIDTVRRWTVDLREGKRRPHTAGLRVNQHAVIPVRGKRQVILKHVNIDGSTGFILAEPLGRMVWGATASHPEPQWLMECLDHRDGMVKHFALADIRQWILPDARGRAEAGLDKAA